MTAQPTSKPGTASSSRISRSWPKAVQTAAGSWSGPFTLETPKEDPARISPEKAAEIQEAAKAVYRALDCRVFARVDLFLTPWGEIVFNEVNTIPGFTAHSRYPGMMAAAGWDFGRLITRLIELGVGA